MGKKFRVWLDFLEKYRYIKSIEDFKFFIPPNGHTDNNTLPKMEQYIGLNALNNEEVFENDIFDIDGIKYYVFYHEDRASYVLTTGKGFDSKNCIDLNCDIIFNKPILGNTHENKDLLNATT